MLSVAVHCFYGKLEIWFCCVHWLTPRLSFRKFIIHILTLCKSTTISWNNCGERNWLLDCIALAFHLLIFPIKLTTWTRLAILGKVMAKGGSLHHVEAFAFSTRRGGLAVPRLQVFLEVTGRRQTLDIEIRPVDGLINE